LDKRDHQPLLFTYNFALSEFELAHAKTLVLHKQPLLLMWTLGSR